MELVVTVEMKAGLELVVMRAGLEPVGTVDMRQIPTVLMVVFAARMTIS